MVINLLDEVCVISRIVKVKSNQLKPEAEADDSYLDLDYSEYH